MITHGRMAREALEAKKILHVRGVKLGVILLEQLKPYDVVAGQILTHLPEKSCRVIFLEEEIRTGGMGMLLCDALAGNEKMKNKTVRVLAVDDEFGLQERDEPIWRSVGVDRDSIVSAVLD